VLVLVLVLVQMKDMYILAVMVRDDDEYTVYDARSGFMAH
jgi:hypothetical protein